MGRKTENSGFVCINCGGQVSPIKKGTIRNHCPFCLHSLHVDIEIGDRQSLCAAPMTPLAVEYNSQKGWQILHKCQKCGFARKNMAADDDDIDEITKIMRGGAYAPRPK
ncbi:MAG: RNHCP domain-containing protein [Defluviitaleaceae bacterium]|nr:RNHCP domain-containing protein [Defluviitaleaceae bacterium]